MADYLAALNEKDVASFYRRLAASIDSRFKGDSLAAILLLHWLDGNGEVKVFSSRFVKGLAEVRSYLKDTVRPIFLSQRRVPSGGIGGVVPRIKASLTARQPVGPYSMHFDGHVEASLSIQAKAYMGLSVDNRELDALYALHGFSVVSDVITAVTPAKRNGTFDVKFTRWTCHTTDYYHWNPAKHISVPNPDFGSSAAGAVAPKEKEITIYHSNAIRIEKAGLAKPFHNRSEPWEEMDPLVSGTGSVSV